jgi:outer membrane receptor for ferrienterochelin and colicins
MLKFYFACMALSLGMSASLIAQKTSLSGNISTKNSDQPLPGAHIYLPGTNIGTATNNQGDFTLRNLQPDSYEVIVSYSGFKRVKKELDLKPGNNELSVQMEESASNLGEVVVTGTGTAHHLKNAPVPTELLNAKAVKSVAANDFEDLMMSLSPSFDFNPNTMGSFMTLNGLRNDYIVVLLNGKRMYGDMGGNTDLNRINPDDIERVEVLKGAASLLYGSDAIAGVVNIITRESHQRVNISNNTRIRKYNTWQQNNSLDLNVGKVSSHTSFSRKSSDGWQLSKYEEDDGELIKTDEKAMKAYEDFTLSQKLDFDITSRLNVYAESSVYEKDMFREPTVGNYGYNFEDYTYGAGAKYLLPGRDYISVSYNHDQYLYYYKYNQDYKDFKEGHRTENNDQRLDDVQIKYFKQISANNRLSVGVDYKNEQIFSEDRVVGGSGEAYTTAVYAQEELTFFDVLDVVAGVRYVKHKEFGNSFTPKISVLYNIGDFNLRGTYGLGYKAPTLKELYYEYEKRGRFYLGNTELEPQESDFVSTGIEYNQGAFSMSITGYRNNVDNMIDYETIDLQPGDDENGINTRRKHFNIEEARTQGVDFLFDVKAGYGFTVGGGYSFVDGMNLTSDSRLEGVAKHYGNVRFGYGRHWKKYHLNTNINGRLQDEKYYEDGNAKAYNVWDLITRHRFTGMGDFIFEISAGIDNVFDFVDDRPYGVHYGTLTPGRTYFLALNINFSK